MHRVWAIAVACIFILAPASAEQSSSTNTSSDGTANHDSTVANSTTEPDQSSPSSDPCHDAISNEQDRLGALWATVDQKWQAFFAGWHVEADKSPQEWDAYYREMDAAAAALHDEITIWFKAELENILADCAYLIEPPTSHYGHAYAAPGHYDACQQEIDALWREGEARVQAGESWEAVKADIEPRVHEIEERCMYASGVAPGEHGHDGTDDMPEGGFEESFGSLTMSWSEAEGRIIVTGKHLELRGIPEEEAMVDIHCGGIRLIDDLRAGGHLGEFRPEQTSSGTALLVFDPDRNQVIGLHDGPRCLINLVASPSIGHVSLDLDDGLACQKEGSDIRCSGAAPVSILVHSGHVEIGDGNAIKVFGRASFALSKGDDVYESAIQRKSIGAEVKVAMTDNGVRVDAQPIGDLEIDVESDGDTVTAYVESGQGDGKTVVFSMDPSVFQSGAEVKAWAVENGTETPLSVIEAASLEDILDPVDDGDIIEYWIIKDKLGFQILVSFPHFSEKRVDMNPVDIGLEGASVVTPGPAPLLLLAALAAIVAVRRR